LQKSIFVSTFYISNNSRKELIYAKKKFVFLKNGCEREGSYTELVVKETEEKGMKKDN